MSQDLDHAAFPHLTWIKREALNRLVAVVTSLLRSATLDQQRPVSTERELVAANQRVSTPSRSFKNDAVKLCRDYRLRRCVEQLSTSWVTSEWILERSISNVLPLPEGRSPRGAPVPVLVHADVKFVSAEQPKNGSLHVAGARRSLRAVLDSKATNNFMFASCLPIDWLARSVKRRSDCDVREVFSDLLVAQKDWPYATVMDLLSTTHVVLGASECPLCTACAVLLYDELSQRCAARDQLAVEHGLPLINAMAVKQGFPLEGGVRSFPVRAIHHFRVCTRGGERRIPNHAD
ncbi:uncharacterized protein PHALS_10767 [Plasmopara halstedii]|uniref:Uncharacterized protein n=1 Tax=Plasmopara halstedii TaxID=4781 RepID=A0A0P1AIJ8_PLAHL|nr:uncharacterized protein PHALS_10767 [Plasmopara halstedii]CEG40578.1 hypothetical protein PHALS_10767 [Plasmopara halstedii]|eukprot:XP_024576947.1 hypothetical protein PHALS_10767 [Plasmopara halstedii]